jgi:sugar phosphate isomerase/epimerase
MKLSGRTQPLYPRYPILQALEVIQRLGFDGVEICLETDELIPSQLTPGQIEKIRDRIQALKLHPHVIGYHKDYIYDDDEFENTKHALRKASLFGTYILIFSGTSIRSGSNEEWKRMISRTRELVRLAENYGVILAQEFEPGFIVGSTFDCLSLFNDIPSPNLAANLDLGHVFLCDPDPLESIRQMGSKIVHGHIENMARGIHNHLLPQEGDIHLKAYIEVLASIRFEGALALDLYQYDYEKVSPEAIRTLRSYF